MKALRYILSGLVFGIILTKGQVISWYRIYEMFKFQSFHMYGIIGSAVVLGVIGTWLLKKRNAKDIDGSEIKISPKEMGITRYLLGGSIFGLGWAMTGACPGPLFILVGNGVWMMGLVIISATFGTFVYGLVRNKFPH